MKEGWGRRPNCHAPSPYCSCAHLLPTCDAFHLSIQTAIFQSLAFWSWLPSGKSLHVNIFVFSGCSILHIRRSLGSDSSSLRSMMSLYRTSLCICWSPLDLLLGVSWRLSFNISMTFLRTSLSGDDSSGTWNRYEAAATYTTLKRMDVHWMTCF